MLSGLFREVLLRWCFWSAVSKRKPDHEDLVLCPKGISPLNLPSNLLENAINCGKISKLWRVPSLQTEATEAFPHGLWGQRCPGVGRQVTSPSMLLVALYSTAVIANLCLVSMDCTCVFLCGWRVFAPLFSLRSKKEVIGNTKSVWHLHPIYEAQNPPFPLDKPKENFFLLETWQVLRSL